MRLGIKSRFSFTVPFQFLLPGTTVDVRRRSQTEYAWLGCDGAEFRLQFPTFSIGRKPWWHILKNDEIICSGQMVNPRFRDAMLRARLPHTEWSIGGELIYVEPWYCSGVIRRADRRRLAVWRLRYCRRASVEIACRSGLPQNLVPVIAGMVLANLTDPANNNGGD